jgi:hypothetical protein
MPRLQETGRGRGAVFVQLLLFGCGDAKRQTLAGCEFEARKIYPDARDLSDPRIVSAAKLCMQSKGYAVTTADMACVTETADYIEIGPCKETVQ